ncbi:MAG: 6-bladed beta-propeller [Burkholderiaceae bacterium]
MQSETEQVVLGDQRYGVQRFWGRWPEGMAPAVLSTLAVDSSGAVYVSQRGGAPVIVFEPNGDYREQWGTSEVTDPHGISIDFDDRVLLVDRDAHEVQIRKSDGAVLGRLGARHHPQYQAPFNHPTSAFATRDGEVYVADGYGNAAVHRFARDGRHLSTWGEPGSGPGQFATPHAVWVDQRDRVLVADRENNRVCVFDRAGKYITSWLGFYHPMDIGENDKGIYVTDQVPRITLVDFEGHIIGRCRPVWNVPHGIACAPNGMIFFVEMKPSSITVMKPLISEER